MSSKKDNRKLSQTGTNNLQVRKSELFVGPLPAPEILKKYDDMIPGAAERIITMSEKQAEHRRKMESKSLEYTARDSLLGMLIGCIIGLMGILVGGFLVYAGKDIQGLTLVIGAIGSLVAVYMRESRNR